MASRLSRSWIVLPILVLSLGVVPGPAGGGAPMPMPTVAAATPAGSDSGTVPIPAPAPDPAALQRLLVLLTDPAIVPWLQKQAAIAATAGPAAVPVPDSAAPRGKGFLQGAVDSLHQRLAMLQAAAAALPDEFDYAATVWDLEMGEGETTRVIVNVLAFLLAGIGVEYGFRRLTAGMRTRLTGAPAPGGLGSRFGRTFLRALLDLVGLALFALASLGAFLAFPWPPIVALLVASFLVGSVIVRGCALIARFLLAPSAPALRLLPVGNRTARFAQRWVLGLASVGATGVLTCHVIRELGFFRVALPLFWLAVDLSLCAMIGILIWQLRGSVAGAIRVAGGSSRLAASLAELFPILGILWVGVIFVLLALGVRDLALTLGLVGLLAPALAAGDAAVATLAGRSHPPIEDQPDRSACATPPEPATDGSPYLAVVDRATRMAIVILFLAMIAAVWRIDLLALTDHALPGSRLLHAVFEIVLTVMLAELVWRAARIAIDTRLEALGGGPGQMPTESGEGGGVAGPGARARTLLPLLRNFIRLVLGTMVIMIVLATLGVNIGPLLAGAGVIGIAVGFGAQTLVRDIVAGVFFLLEDAFRVGEYVEIGELRGTVEAISLRSLRLRHHRGAIHTLPFGEMKSITNYSRDWIIMKLEFRLPFGTDLQLVKKLVKQVGRELQEDAELGRHLLEPPKSQGIRRLEEFNMVVGIKFMTTPGEQWVMRRETYHRILAAFCRHGIALATRDVLVRVDGQEAAGLSPEGVRRAAAAAAESMVGAVDGDRRPAA